MRSLGRFVTRPSHDNQADLILGACFKGSSLKPGTVYAIEEIMDTLTLREVGPAAIGMTSEDSLLGVSWAWEFGSIPSCSSNWYLFTREEVMELYRKGKYGET